MQTDSDTLNSVNSFIGIENEHIWVRLIIVCIVLFVFNRILFRKLKDVKLVRKIFIKIAKLDFIFPIIILGIILVIEYYIMIKLSNDIYHFWEAFATESLIIIATFLLLFYFTIWIEFKKEKVDERNFWRTYSNKLNDSSEQILALNVSHISNFFKPLAIRYFYNQVEIIKMKRKTNKDFIAQRIIVLPNENKSDLAYYSMVNNALKENAYLNDNERIFFNITKFHKHENIDLYLIPKSELLKITIGKSDIIKDAWFELIEEKKSRFQKIVYKCTFPLFRNKIAIKILDNLIIDKEAFYTTNKGKNLEFHELKKEFASFIEELFVTIRGRHNDYHIEPITDRVNQNKS